LWLIFTCLLLVIAGCNLPAPDAPAPKATLLPSPRAHTPTATATRTAQPSPLPTLMPSVPPAATATLYPPVTRETFIHTSKWLGGVKKTITVYLPGDYQSAPERRYKVLYASDGQEFPLFPFEQYLNSLVASHQMEPVIVVAIQTADGDLRHEELGTGTYINVFGWGTLSDAYNKFMVNELVPAINARYRTQTGPQNTAIMGWSLGGLVAFYDAWQYPATFGIAGAFSPSFWWRLKGNAGEELLLRVAHKVVRETPKAPRLRLWFEAGTKEESGDIDRNGVDDVIQDIQDLMKELELKGYQRGVDMVYVQVEGGKHELTTWTTVLPDFLRFAFPAQ
jgi:enterochelin esterase-like enzyme